MKKLLLLFILIFPILSQNVLADCQIDFMSKYDVMDSKALSVHDNALAGDFYENSESYVKEAISYFVRDIRSCQNEKGSALISNVKCHELIPGKVYSKNCIAESEIGYFFVSLDMLDNVNIIFNRWD